MVLYLFQTGWKHLKTELFLFSMTTRPTPSLSGLALCHALCGCFAMTAAQCVAGQTLSTLNMARGTQPMQANRNLAADGPGAAGPGDLGGECGKELLAAMETPLQREKQQRCHRVPSLENTHLRILRNPKKMRRCAFLEWTHGLREKGMR
eukprot:EG_transcript_16386